jgi:hypothetical protein
MATTWFNVYGYLGYELVIDGSVQTNVLFALVDAKQELLAWYGFRQDPAPWHRKQFEAYNLVSNGISDIGGLTNPGSYMEPEENSNFATADHGGTLFLYPGRLSVAGLVAHELGRSFSLPADLEMKDDARVTRCILSIPAVRPVSALLAFNLVRQRKRRTRDLKKEGQIILIEVVPFRCNTLVVGPNPITLNEKGFRNHVAPLLHEQFHHRRMTRTGR